ncbi:MAG TPA: SCO family protein [Opitutus sp.]|nr:SCO family protein [Opitutus sp.]
MKTSFLSCALGAALAFAPGLRAADSCCSQKEPAVAAVPACCAAPVPEAEAVPAISDRSIYQLDASWSNDAGQAVSLSAFRGRPVVVAMFFASCTYACPILVDDVKRLLNELPAAARAKTQVVLVSFDSERDTPAALHAYRERMHLDPATWTLLHGEAPEVQELAMLLGVKFKRDARGEFSHSNLITVLDAEGEIVHQRGGLQGEVAEAARAVSLVAR